MTEAVGSLISGYVVGAYAAASTLQGWDPSREEEILAGLVAHPKVAALEIPFAGSIHPHDDEWQLTHFPSSLSAVVTSIPHVMNALSHLPSYGLASDDAAGHTAALNDVAEMRVAIERLNNSQGRRVVDVVELHAAGRFPFADPLRLRGSLETISRWDWGGARLVIEHQDAYIPGQEFQKGFLSLEDEITAIEDSGTDIGIAVNWGRSAIEGRSVEAPINHITSAREAGVLRGVMVSGASDREGETSSAWADAHHAFQRSSHHPHGDDVSLLTERALAPALAAAGVVEWFGVKVAWPESRRGSAAQRLEMIADAIAGIERARGSVAPN